VAGEEITLSLWMRNLPKFKSDAREAANAVDQIGASAASASRTSSGAVASAEKSSGKFGVAMKSMAKTGALVAVAGGLGIVSMGVRFEAMKEQAQIAFTTMMGDSGKAKRFLGELQTFAAKTPFELPGLIQSSQKLMAMGFAAEDVQPMLTSVGDAAAGLGLAQPEMDGMIMALGQMKAKGKASSEEMMQLTERGVPAWQMLAKAMGTDTATAMKKVSEGAVDADTAIAAVTRGMNDRFGGMMAKQSQTLAGQWSSIKDGARQAAGNLIAPFIPQLKSLTAWLNKTLADPDVQKGLKRTGEIMADGMQYAGGLISKLSALRGPIKAFVGFITAAYDKTVSLLDKVEAAWNWLPWNHGPSDSEVSDWMTRVQQQNGATQAALGVNTAAPATSLSDVTGGRQINTAVNIDGRQVAHAVANVAADRRARRGGR
jgi:tape measure domain-containing protein